jgi:hypothetical protein
MKSLQLGNDRKSDFKKSIKFKAGNFFLGFFKNDTKLKELFNSLFYFMEYRSSSDGIVRRLAVGRSNPNIRTYSVVRKCK